MKNLFSLNKYLLKYKWYLFGGILFVTLSSLLGNYQAVIVRKATNDIVSGIAKHEFNGRSFWIYFLILVGLSVISGIFMFLMRQTIIVMSRYIEYDQKNEMYAHFQKMDSQFLKMQSIGDLMNKISEDISRVRMYTGPAIMYLVNTLVAIVTVMTFMLSVSPKLTLFVLLPLPIFSWAIFKLSLKINTLSTKVQALLSDVTSFVQESVSSIRLIKVHGKEDVFNNTLYNKNSEYMKYNVALGKTEALFQPIMIMMVGTGIIITIWVGGWLLQQNKIEPGNITEFIMYIYRLTWPFTALGWVSALIQRASASQKRINDLMNIRSDIVNNQHYRPEKINGDIIFQNVSFTYKESNIQALKNINFNLHHGKKIGIAGKVASGKTSILQLLLRFYDADSGKILIDGIDIQNYDLNFLRKNIAYVPQDSFLFNDTVKNNIIFPNTEIAQGKLIKICKQVEMHETIMSWPEQYNTIIGERGVNVSGGQRQRLALARALVKDAPIILIDDTFSALDNSTEKIVVENLKKDLSGKTVIVVSQKLSALRYLADEIFYFKNGAVTEHGTHDELIKLNGEYAALYAVQIKGTD